MTTPVRVALYLRVATRRQADSGLSIPDQRRQAKRYCEVLGLPPIGYRIVEAAEQPGHRTKKTLEIGSI